MVRIYKILIYKKILQLDSSFYWSLAIEWFWNLKFILIQSNLDNSNSLITWTYRKTTNIHVKIPLIAEIVITQCVFSFPSSLSYRILVCLFTKLCNYSYASIFYFISISHDIFKKSIKQEMLKETLATCISGMVHFRI